MSKVHFMSLSAIRKQDPAAFDAAIKQAFHEAALIVGYETVKEGIYGPDQAEVLSKAA